MSRKELDVLIYRCSDGHLFKLSFAGRILALHLGAKKFARCPVDGRWRMIRPVPRNELTDSELRRVEGDTW